MDGETAAIGEMIRNESRITKELTATHRRIAVLVGPHAGVGWRADKFLAAALVTLSRSLIRSWFDQGYARINGKVIKASQKVRAGDRLLLVCPLPPNPEQYAAEPPPLQILYDRDGILAVNKPPGQLAHQAGRVLTGTLLNQLQDLMEQRGGDPSQARLVNRIDRDTSGIVLCTLDEEVNRALSIALQDGAFSKRYRAICLGVPEPEHGDWRQSIRDDPTGRSIARQVHPLGQVCHTEYRVLERAPGDRYALLDIDLHTGRQHQIRVHAAANGHPLVGDWTYGPACVELAGQALHAAELTFPHPHTGEPVTITAPLTDALAELWGHLRSGDDLTTRPLTADECRKLGVENEAEREEQSLLPPGWRRPSWMSLEELRRATGEQR